MATLVDAAEVVSADDAALAALVRGRLAWAPAVPGETVQVAVEAGFVTLTGQVATAGQRRLATLVVRLLSGVTGVSNQTTVRPRRG